MRSRILQMNLRRNLSFSILMAIGFMMLLIPGCTTRLVQPYNEKLLNDTEAFYKKAATMIEEGRAASPKTDEQRDAISIPARHPANVSAFEPKYNALVVDSETLILGAMTGDKQISSAGKAIQGKINELIEETVPTQCPELRAEVGKAGLTAANFVDLKCLILKWRAEHGNETLTRGTGILKKANWEGRKVVLFNTILAIQTAESFKKER
jgi:hypothetical protein